MLCASARAQAVGDHERLLGDALNRQQVKCGLWRSQTTIDPAIHVQGLHYIRIYLGGRMKRDGRGFDHGTLKTIRGQSSEYGKASIRQRWWLHTASIARRSTAGSARRQHRCGSESAALQAGDGSATQFDAASRATGVSLDQWSRSASVWPDFGLWTRSLVAVLIERGREEASISRQQTVHSRTMCPPSPWESAILANSRSAGTTKQLSSVPLRRSISC